MATKHLDTLTTAMKWSPAHSTNNGNIKITHRNERSLYTYVIHTVCRSFRRYLGRAEQEYPAGSQKLRPHRIVMRSATVSERIVADIRIYDIHPRKLLHKNTEPSKRMYYFCGGGWQRPPAGQHWQVCAKLARELNQCVSVVSYPLAPNSPAAKTIPALLRFYRTVMAAAEEAGEKVTFAGDSSGGNIVLALVLEALREDAELKGQPEINGKDPPHPHMLMVISPSTDLTRSNPDIEKLKRFDPILTVDFIKATAKGWAGELDRTDTRLSPNFADVSLLAKAGIKVHGVTGGYDILMPDAIAFRHKCAEAGVSGEWLEWDKQMHCFVLTWPYGVHEAREAVGWMIEVLKKE